jgi:hypothetical protein
VTIIRRSSPDSLAPIKSKQEEKECVIIIVDPDRPTDATNTTTTTSSVLATKSKIKTKISMDAVPSGSLTPNVLAPLPIQVINERTLIFRMDSRTLWTRYSLGMINYSVTAFGKLTEREPVKNNLSRNASGVGTYFVPYYGITAGTKISGLLDAILKTGVKVVDTIDKGTADSDVAVYQEIWAQQTRALAQYLNELNPAQYPTDLVNEMLINLTEFWLADFQARKSGDFAADAIALDNILKVAVIGIPDHANKGYSSLADILSRGVIAQYPLSFTE